MNGEYIIYTIALCGIIAIFISLVYEFKIIPSRIKKQHEKEIKKFQMETGMINRRKANNYE